jgi:Raf kinase inhibitor-like YbhB/YbcL family protein
VAVATVCAVFALSACDTGDGTTLQDPVAPTTLPPIDTTPLESVAIDPTDALLATVAPPDDVAEPPAPLPGETGLRLFTPWAEGGPIDARFGCDGSNAAPPLSWSDLPDGTVEVAVALVDESNLSNGRPFVHWVMAGLTPATPGLAEGEVPIGAIQALNFFGNVAYDGPCPTLGETNSYRVTLFALNQQVELADGTPATQLLDLIDATAIESASVLGTSTR